MDALIPFVTAMVGIFVGYFLNQALYEKKRRDELKDRVSNRRTVILDMRIKEARDYVDLWHQLIQAVREFHRILIDEPKLIVSNMEVHKKNHANLAMQIQETMQKNSTSITLLRDNSLQTLNQELSSIMYPKLLTQVNVITKFILENKYDVEDSNIKILEVPDEAEILITKMKQRLDELAQGI